MITDCTIALYGASELNTEPTPGSELFTQALNEPQHEQRGEQRGASNMLLNTSCLFCLIHFIQVNLQAGFNLTLSDYIPFGCFYCQYPTED